MAAHTYKSRCIVLRKKKLRESDLIVTFINDAGEKIDAVAHGARRPGGSLAGRMETYSEVDLVCSKGRNLDVVSDCRLVSDASRRFEMEQAMCAAPVAELLCALIQPELKQERLYDLARSAFDAIAASEPDFAPVLAAAALLKACAVSGLRPVFASCVLCGTELPQEAGKTAFSCSEGGMVCDSCRRPYDAIVVDRETLRWCNALLYSRFEEIAMFSKAPGAASAVFEVARSWIFAHVGVRLKSLDMLMSMNTQALFQD